MRSLFNFLFSIWIAPILGKFAVTVTPSDYDPPRVIGNDGLVRVGKSLALSGTYATGGVPLSAAMFGLSRFKPLATLVDTVDPWVTQFNQGSLPANMLAIVNLKLIRLVYPTGGATAAPTTPAAPKSTTGASTASAVNATTPDITPGIGKELPNGGDVSSMVLIVYAEGYL